MRGDELTRPAVLFRGSQKRGVTAFDAHFETWAKELRHCLLESISEAFANGHSSVAMCALGNDTVRRWLSGDEDPCRSLCACAAIGDAPCRV